MTHKRRLSGLLSLLLLLAWQGSVAAQAPPCAAGALTTLQEQAREPAASASPGEARVKSAPSPSNATMPDCTPEFRRLVELRNRMKPTDDALRAMTRPERERMIEALKPQLEALFAPLPPEADSEFLHAIQFAGKSMGWAMDWNGTLQRSEDGGLHWTKIRVQDVPSVLKWVNPHAGAFRSMHFADENFGVIVGLGPAHWTEDGGLTWKDAPPLSFLHPIYAVFCLAPKVCVAAGDEPGIVYKSDKFPLSWKRINSPATGPVAAMQFIGDVGWAVTQSGQILGATDAGAHWKELFHDSSKTFNALDFFDPLHGWVVGARGVVLRTQDGGKTWEDQTIQMPPQFPPERLRLHAVKFASARQGWVAGLNGVILGTQDGGNCWTLQRNEGAASWLSIYALAITPGPAVWAAGNLANIFVSTDKGAFWFPIHGPAVDVWNILERAVAGRAKP